MPSILIAPYEAEAMCHIRNLCARGFHVTGVTDKIAVEGHPASIEIRYESGDRIAELEKALGDFLYDGSEAYLARIKTQARVALAKKGAKR
jgi:hypothetical protein